MIIAACNCGAAITGEDRDAVTEAVSAHLYKTPMTMTGIGVMADHSALIGEADAKIALTAVETSITEEAP